MRACNDYDIVVVGAGLTGLSVANHLATDGYDVCVFEKRPRTGGRILTKTFADNHFDLGPAWFWDGQPLIAALAEELGATVFLQHSEGDLLYEDPTGSQITRRAMSMMAGARRIEGGFSILTDGLAARLPEGCVHLDCSVQAINTNHAASIDVNPLSVQIIANGTKQSVSAKYVVIALPPRLAATTINLQDVVSDSQHQSMLNIPTWMAGHAKAMAVYDQPFWRQQGLSGDAVSHRGPLVQIHDASPADGKSGALFGFVGIPATMRKGNCVQLKQEIQQQLIHLFGQAAASPNELWLQDWIDETATATEMDVNAPAEHPAFGMPPNLKSLQLDNVQLAATELVSVNGGLLEGALESAWEVVRTIKQRF